MRHGFTPLDLAQPFPDCCQKLHPLGDDFQAGVRRQALDRIQDKLLVAHGCNLPQTTAEGNDAVSHDAVSQLRATRWAADALAYEGMNGGGDSVLQFKGS